MIPYYWIKLKTSNLTKHKTNNLKQQNEIIRFVILSFKIK